MMSTAFHPQTDGQSYMHPDKSLGPDGVELPSSKSIGTLLGQRLVQLVYQSLLIILCKMVLMTLIWCLYQRSNLLKVWEI